ncbi:MAG: RelA/SpoT family protein [Bacteroidia bacterium]
MGVLISPKAYAPQERSELLRSYRRLIGLCQDFTSKSDREEIKKAFRYAEAAHRGTRRRSGEPYILHPLAVAQILVREIGVRDKIAVIAALLHDVVEDTSLELEDIERNFGSSVARLVDGLTKVSQVSSVVESIQAETLRKILLTMANDIRVALIKIADRLHNLRTLDGLRAEKQEKILAETEFIYVPIVHRFGLYAIKSEMEDAILRLRLPEVYDEIARKLHETAPEREVFLREFIRPIEERLQQELDVPFRIKSRLKSISSIYHKMQKQGVPFEKVYDLFAVRIILDSPPMREKADCWRVYSIVTSLYVPNLNRLRDWITTSKATGYEALHITVMGPQGRWVEVQIRSRRMDENAEKGIGAHWKYKTNGKVEVQDQRLENWLNRIRELLENNAFSSVEAISEISPHLVGEEVYVFTPKGELKVLPAGSTALDFAYEIHSEIGWHAIAAKVNHRLVELNYVLQGADQVEIITSQRAMPTEEQLTFVRTAKARQKIREALRQQRRQAIEKGKTLFQWRIAHMGISETDPMVKELLWYLRLSNLEELYYRLGAHKIEIQRIIQYLRMKKASRLPLIDQLVPTPDPDALPVGRKEEPYQYATCCMPIPFDAVVGYASADGLVIHRTICPEVQKYLSLESHHIRPVRWVPTPEKEFLTAILIEGEDRLGMLSDIVKLLSVRKRKNLRAIFIQAEASYFKGEIHLYTHTQADVEVLLQQLMQIPGVLKAQRTLPQKVSRPMVLNS